MNIWCFDGGGNDDDNGVVDDDDDDVMLMMVIMMMTLLIYHDDDWNFVKKTSKGGERYFPVCEEKKRIKSTHMQNKNLNRN